MIRVDYMRLSALRAAPRNPKRHDVEGIGRSTERFGFVSPVILDDATGSLVAGHGRVEALAARKAAGGSPPERITVDGDDWLVPTVRGVAFADAREAEAYLLADNQLTLGAAWGEGLPEMLRELRAADALDGLGFSDGDLRKLLGRDESAEIPAPIEQAAELQVKWGTEPGQMWHIGKHRLLCGDATKADDVARLLGAEVPFLCVTDPPYGVDYDPSWRNVEAAKGNLAYAARRIGEVANDHRADWREAWTLFPGDVIYSWHPAGATSLVHAAALQDSGFPIRMQIIWAKSNFPIGRGDYHVRHEPCWYAVRAGRAARRTDDRTQTTLWEINLDRNVSGGHSTQKPVECMARPIRNHEADTVYDPFLGSGTTLVAAEQLGRRGYGLEIEPKYVAVTLERLASMGLKPERCP